MFSHTTNIFLPCLLPLLQTGVFQKMRRRLTVTGASETIDGVAKMSVSDEDQRQKMVRIPCRGMLGCVELCWKAFASAASDVS